MLSLKGARLQHPSSCLNFLPTMGSSGARLSTQSMHKIDIVAFCVMTMINKLFPSLLLAAAFLLAYSHRYLANAASFDKENEFRSILQRMETDVLAFRDEMERVYSARCETKTLTECAETNFNDCSSTFPSQQCAKADELVFSACGDGETCNGE